MEMSERERALRRRCRDDFPYYARKCLTIRPRAGGGLVTLELNAAQTYLHQQAEDQKKRTGRVRKIIVKGRQEGISTYIGARGYHRTTHNRGTKAFILTHMQDATDNLFRMVSRFHSNNNELLKPTTGASNAKELSFPLLDSGYVVGTAGSKGVGRSDSFQFFHGSECGFWPNADEHIAGALQAIPDLPGTEAFLESTANGLGNYFAEEWARASAGESAFEPVFIPWFWEPSYCHDVPDDFVMTAEEEEYANAYGLMVGQVAWMRAKRVELKTKFDQEYPATPELAFQSSGEGCFISPVRVSLARKRAVTPGKFVPLVLGVDPGRGGDPTAVIDRQGRAAGQRVNELWDVEDLMVVAGRVANLIRKLKPLRVFIDITGLGSGVYDRLAEQGFGDVVQGINFASASNDDAKWANKRAEMWDEMREWFCMEPGVQCPDEDLLAAEVTAPIWGPGKTRTTSSGGILIEDKESIRKRLKRSPNKADALALTFAQPVASEVPRPSVAESEPADSIAGY